MRLVLTSTSLWLSHLIALLNWQFIPIPGKTLCVPVNRVLHACNPSIYRLKKENHAFKVIPGYIVSSSYRRHYLKQTNRSNSTHVHWVPYVSGSTLALGALFGPQSLTQSSSERPFYCLLSRVFVVDILHSYFKGYDTCENIFEITTIFLFRLCVCVCCLLPRVKKAYPRADISWHQKNLIWSPIRFKQRWVRTAYYNGEV